MSECRSIVSLLALVITASVSWADAKPEADAVAALEKAGAKITRDDTKPGKPVVEVGGVIRCPVRFLARKIALENEV
jgi:hypothetical protein